MNKRTSLYILLVALFLIASIYQFRFVQRRIEYLTSPETFATNQIFTSASGRFTSVTETAKAAGIRVGDELLEVEGRPFTGSGVLDDAVFGKHSADLLTVTIRRAGAEQSQQESITFPIGKGVGDGEGLPTLGLWTFVIGITVLIPIFCLLVGFYVAALRPRDPLAWLLLGLMLSFSLMPAGFDPQAWKGVMRDAAIVYHTGARSLWSVFMLLFGIYFPERLSLDRRWPWAKWLFIVPLTLFAVAAVVSDVGDDRNPASVQALNNLLARFGGIVAVLQMIATGLFFTFIGMKMGVATSPDARRRLRMLLFGAQISLTPIFILVLVSLVQRKPPLSGVAWWLLLIASLMLLLFPLTLAHVIVVQRAMDVSVVIRQGVRYTFARGGVLTLRFAIIGAIIFLMIGAIKKPATNPLEISLIVFIGFTAMFVIGHLGERLIKWTDRRFFREAVNAEQVLSNLSDNVRTMVEAKPLIETVTRTISDSLHVPRVTFLLKEVGGAYKPAYSMGYPDPPTATFPFDAQTVERLKEKKAPIRVYLDDRDGWVEKTANGSERDLLERLNTELLLPLGVKNELSGFISLGAKQSEAPYSPTDLKLLQSVAMQTGLALENSQLTAAIASAVAQRETMNREVEIAREVQERLFPQNLAEIQGLDYCGACRPALGVGGDYYDFLVLPNGVLGIAIGDVSGKGIAAALLMASLQASLRGQAIRGTTDLADMIVNVNRLVYDASASNRYATFFYAQYEPGTRRLTYVNAGHNPPMILRKQGVDWQIIRLEEGGAVVGLLPNFPYTQATVDLEKGDLLLAFTDGISEAMNPEEEEWGEENLIETAKACDGLSAADMISVIVEAADRFAAGAKQHDDMTLMIVRVI